jgi:hypothetical protein
VSAARKWSVPPGYRTLDDIVREYGRDHAQTNLISGQWPAFELDLSTGDLKPIPATTWGVTRGRKWLEKGEEGESVWLKPAAWSQIGLDCYALIVRMSEQPPPRTDNPKDEDGPQVRRAKILMGAVYRNGEWRSMMIKAVRDACAKEAQGRGWRLPSTDSFSIAMGRRRRKGRRRK